MDLLRAGPICDLVQDYFYNLHFCAGKPCYAAAGELNLCDERHRPYNESTITDPTSLAESQRGDHSDVERTAGVGSRNEFWNSLSLARWVRPFEAAGPAGKLSKPAHGIHFVPSTWYTVFAFLALTKGARRAT